MTYLAGVKWLLGISLALALAAGGCDNGDDGDSAPRTTVPPATSTTTTAPADPYAVPATIDEAYVQRVVQKLYEIEDEALRLMVRDKRIGPEAGQLLEAMFLPNELNAQIEGWLDVIDSGGLAAFRDDPGSVVIVQLEIIQASPQCISVRLIEDASASLKAPAEPAEVFLVLGPRNAVQDPGRRNPTPWMVARESTSREQARCEA